MEEEASTEPLKTVRLEQIKSVGQTQKESTTENVMEIHMADRVLLMKSEMEGMCDQLTAWQKAIVAAKNRVESGSGTNPPSKGEAALLKSLRRGQVFAMSSVMNKWITFRIRATVDNWRRNFLVVLSQRKLFLEAQARAEEAEAASIISSVRDQISAMGTGRSPAKGVRQEGKGGALDRHPPTRSPAPSAAALRDGGEVMPDSEQACQEAFHGAAGSTGEGSTGVTVAAMVSFVLSLDPLSRPKGLGSISAWKENEMQKGLQSCANSDGLIDYEDFGSWWRTWDF